MKVHYQKSYDFTSDITYMGEEGPGEHYFRIIRREDDNLWEEAEDECFALIEDGKLIGFEGYSEIPNFEEEVAMMTILKNEKILI